MANMVIYINNDNTVGEMFPENDINFPNIPIENRYQKEFLDHCIILTDNEFKEKAPSSGYIYNWELNNFIPPEITLPPSPGIEEELIENDEGEI